jgi:hypothetical protein
MKILFTCPQCQAQVEITEDFIGQSGPCFSCGKVVVVSQRTVTRSIVDSEGAVWSADEAFQKDRRGQFWGSLKLLLVALLLGLAGAGAVALFLWGILPLMGFDAETARHQRIQEKITRIANALRQYHDDYGRLPPPVVYDDQGKPMHSWRAMVLPYLDDEQLFQDYRFDEPWDSSHNTQLHSRAFEPFQLPGNDLTTSINHTGFMVIVGTDTLFPNNQLGTPLSAATDGLGSTVLVVEVDRSGVHWLKPVDLDSAAMSFSINRGFPGSEISDPSGQGGWVVMADGKPQFLKNEQSPDEIQRLATRASND